MTHGLLYMCQCQGLLNIQLKRVVWISFNMLWIAEGGAGLKYYLPPPPPLHFSESRIPPDQKGIHVISLMTISTSPVLKQRECASFVLLFSLFTFYSFPKFELG